MVKAEGLLHSTLIYPLHRCSLTQEAIRDVERNNYSSCIVRRSFAAPYNTTMEYLIFSDALIEKLFFYEL